MTADNGTIAPLVCSWCGAVVTLADLDDPSVAGSGADHINDDGLCGPVYTRFCFIDGCAKPATFVALSHPDMVTLCTAHSDLYQPEPWDEIVIDERQA